MISSIHSTTVYVADQEKAKAFYADTLGWNIAMDSTMPGMRWITVVPPGAVTELSLGHVDWIGGKDAVKTGWTGITLATPDIDATFETLTARGVRFKGPIETMPWGDRATWFYDLDDNEFFLVGTASSSA